MEVTSRNEGEILSPLSPSRLAINASPRPSPAPPVAISKNRLMFEEDPDFFGDGDDDPVPYESNNEEGESTKEVEAPRNASRSEALDGEEETRLDVNAKMSASEDVEMDLAETEMARGEEKKELKMVLEVAEGFEDDEDDEGPVASTSATLSFAPVAAYTTPYSNLSSLNLSLTGTSSAKSPLTPVVGTTFSGSKVTFMRRRKPTVAEDSSNDVKERSAALANLSRSMLGTPFHVMVAQIETETKEKEKAEKDKANRVDVKEPSPLYADGTLWTDRYRPKKFTELLGDDRMHRSALLWLKEWDQCAFKGSEKDGAAAELKRERRKKRARAGAGKDAPAFGGGDDENVDPWGRPTEKILLLSGPPGLGKTTLAHVLAKQAGYLVFEVNASDERTGDVVEQRLRNVLESRAITAQGKLEKNRPTCLVVDEIDGAASGDSGFVRKLAKLVMDGSSTRTPKGKGKSKEKPPLRTPIICICNNLYAPVLRPLRPLARIIRFAPPTNLMLVNRLRSICDEEHLAVDSKNLTLLTEVAEGDLRSCLNTLQFIKRDGKPLNSDAIRATLVGKDTGISANSMVEKLFKKPMRKKGVDTGDEKWLERIVGELFASGEYEKLSLGCFENYLNARQTNDALPRVEEALECLMFYDQLNGRVRAERTYELYGYIPYAFAPWYKLFSSHTANKIESSGVAYEMLLQEQAHQQVAATFRNGLSSEFRSLFNGPSIALELMPLMNRIIAPDIKPLNRQLIKADERAVMLKLVHTMLAMKLTFVQDKNEDGQLTYRLDPPIDVFIHFEGKRATDIAASRYAVRHLIVQEMKAEEIRRSNVAGGVATTASDILAAYNVGPASKTVKAETKDAVDFFGRAIEIKPEIVVGEENEEEAPPPPKRVHHAVYRYHEGFSNAVRVTKRVADFLL